MGFTQRLVSPGGVEVPVGSAAEEVNLRARGYRPVKAAEVSAPATPGAAVDAAETEVTKAHTQAAATKADLAATRKSAASALDAANTELSKTSK